jgi:NAD(P)H dehydrogenase (quinone)
MHNRSNVVMFYIGGIESLHRLAIVVCETVWDAGANLRVRRIGQVDALESGRFSAERVEFLRELEEIPPATLEDLEWADVALFGISPRNDKIPLGFDRLIEDAKIRWRAGGLANKLYYVFSPATICIDALEGSPLPLSDLFRRSAGGSGQVSRPTRLAHRRVHATLPDSTADGGVDPELAAARALGRRAASGTLAVGNGQYVVSDVA